MRMEISPIVRAVLILVALAFICSGMSHVLSAPPEKPHLTDAQKLEIRNAQIAFFQAQAELQASPVYQQFQKAQQHLNETAQKVTKEAGVDPAKFSLGPDLEFTPTSQKPEPPKLQEKK